jgi:hypothetical protein
MEKLLSKWYFGLIILPILVNLLTNAVGFPDLFKEWSVTAIATLSFLVLVLINEIFILSNRLKNIEFAPKASDKKIVKNLLDVLDIDIFHEEIANQDSWYGYKQEAIRKSIDFSQSAGLVSNRTSDSKLNVLILGLKKSIDDFHSYSSKHLYNNGDFYSPDKNTDYGVDRAKKAQPIMNEKAEDAFAKLTLLIDYLKRKNYLE